MPLPPPLGVKLLQRPADEPLGKALGRLRATVEKARKKQGIQEAPRRCACPRPPPVPNARLEDPRGDGEIIAEDVPNALAWRDGLFLVVDGVGRFRVRVDAPSVATATVAGEAAVGRPLVANAGGVRFCAEDDLDWRWFRGKGEAALEIAVAGARTSPRRRTSARRSWRRRGRTPPRAIPTRVAPRVRRDRPGGDPRARATARARARRRHSVHAMVHLPQSAS